MSRSSVQPPRSVTQLFVESLRLSPKQREVLDTLQKFDKGGESYYKLKQKLVSSQENWLKNFYEGLKDLTKDVYFVNLCAAEQFRVSSEVSFIQQRILELTDEYKKYLD